MPTFISPSAVAAPEVSTPSDRRITLRLSWRYCVVLYALVMLYSSLHKFVHHVAGYVACGAWGVKTFNYFSTTCEGTLGAHMATFAGPVFTFGTMWVGWWFLQRAASTVFAQQLGFALIFAQLPLQRITGPIFKQNDEYYAAWHLFGVSEATRWITFAIICAICLPPLIAAWRSIANRRRTAWFLLYFTLLPYLLWGPVFALLEYLLTKRGVLAATVIGIPYLFILNEVATIALYYGTRRWLLPAAEQQQ